MFIAYKAIRGDYRHSGTSEQSEKVDSGPMPQVNDVVDMGGHRPWRVIKIETYQAGDDRVVMAAVIPDGAMVPPETEWTGIYWPDYPDRTFTLAIAPDGKVITTESHMDGKPMQGRVELSTIVNGRPALPLSDWVVERVVTYQPEAAHSAYAGIHLCYCLFSPRLVAAEC
jgi:hypothetical protein